MNKASTVANLMGCRPHAVRWELWPQRPQFSSVTQLCPTLCNPMDCSVPGLSVHHQLQEFTQAHVHWISDAIQPSLLSPHPSSSPPAFNLSQHQGLFLWTSSSHQVAKVLELENQHQSFQWIFRTDCLSPSAFSFSQHQGLFLWVSSSHQLAKVLKLQLQLQH